MRICRGDRIGIPDRAARLHDGCNASSSCLLDRIRERKECIRGHHRALCLITSTLGRNPDAVHPVRLATANPNRRLALRQNDRIGFHVLAGFPCKAQRIPFSFIRRTSGDDFPIRGCRTDRPDQPIDAAGPD